MTIPKEDERAPGPTVLVMGATVYALNERNTNQWCAHVQGPSRTEAEAIAEQIAKACNAYGSTDALRSALAKIVHLASEMPDDPMLDRLSSIYVTAYAALKAERRSVSSSVTAPSEVDGK